MAEGVMTPSAMNSSYRREFSAHAVAQEAAGVGGGFLVVVDGDLAVDDDPAVAVGALDPAPLVAGEVVHDLTGPRRQPFVVVDDDVGRPADTDGAPVAKAGERCGEGGQPPVCLFQRHELALPD